MSNSLDYLCTQIQTNVIQINIVMTIEEIKQKTIYGDYVTLARMLGIHNSQTAKNRLFSGNEEAKKAMELIITSREELITEFQKKQ